MIKDFFDSFTDNIREKTRNPFLGTYAIVWLIRNWYVVYMVFNFDKECTIDDKLRLITEYFERNPFWINVGININYTFGILIGTYVLLNLSRVIVNSFEKNVTPWIYKITDMSSIVKKEEYDVAVKRINELNAVIEEERNKRYKLQEAYENSKQELDSVKISLSDYMEQVKKYKISEREEKNKISSIEKYYNKIVEESLLEDFVKLVSYVRKGSAVNKTYKPMNRFLELGFFKSTNSVGDNSKYILTNLGEELMDYINLKD